MLLGNLLVDDIVFPDGSTRMGQAGGAIMYGALGAALWGTLVGCVSLVGTDYAVTMLDALEERRVDLTGVHRLGGPGLRTWILYEGHARRLIHRLGCPTHEQVSPGPEHIPRAWRSVPAFYLAPMPFSVQRRVLAALTMNANHFVSIDPHLPVTDDTLDDWRQVLADADAFFPSEDELLLEGIHVDPHRVLPRLATGRLRFIAFKQAARGGILYDAREDRFYRWAGRALKVIDPTGAGDAFAAGFVSAHLEGLPVAACLDRGVVSASFAIEAVGAASLLQATRSDADDRIRQWSLAGASA
ncbi:MAG: carbohydrate kinase family protein [Gemmatimonadales bacterium]